MALRKKVPVLAPTETNRYPCTQCGGNAYIGYSAVKKHDQDFGGRIKKGERLCTKCFRTRGGIPFF